MATCPRCKSEVEVGARFCGNCGTPTGVVGAEPAAAPAPAVDALGDTVPPPDEAPLTLDQLVGKVLNRRYRIDRKLGEGGFGAVFEGVHLQMGRPVAVKVLHPTLTRDSHMVERFRREAQAACNLRDPHTVTTHDFDEAEQGVLYIVMELIRGRSLLQEIQQRGALEPGRAVALLDQVCSALAEAHALEIVHRDIKPENILIEDRPSQPDFVKVVDFGIARMIHDPRGDTIAKLTAAGQIFGTLEYMSPEQLAGGDIDHRADIYALGAMLYQMLTGVPPFSGSPSQLIAAHLSSEPPPPSSQRGAIPPALDQIVLRCMAKDPSDRFADVHALRQAMARAVARADAAPAAAGGTVPPTAVHAGPTAPPAPPPGPAPQIPATRAPAGPASTPRRAAAPDAGIPAWVWIAIAITVVLVVAVGAYAIYGAAQSSGGEAQAPAGGVTRFSGSTASAPGAKVMAPSAPVAEAKSSTPAAARWPDETALLRLVPPETELLLLLRPARMMRLQGMDEIWRRHLASGAGEMARTLDADPRKMELALLAFPRLPREEKEPDGLAVVRGVDAAKVLTQLGQKKTPETESHRGHTLYRFPKFALVQLDERTLLGGTPGTVKQGLEAAADGTAAVSVDGELLGYMRALLPARAQREVRRWFHMRATARVERVVVTVSKAATDVVLSAELHTDSPRTARVLAGWVRQILHNQGNARAAALLRRASVTPGGDRVVVRLEGAATEIVAAGTFLASEDEQPRVR